MIVKHSENDRTSTCMSRAIFKKNHHSQRRFEVPLCNAVSHQLLPFLFFFIPFQFKSILFRIFKLDRKHPSGDSDKQSTEKQELEPDVCCSVSGKSGLRVNFLAVICRRAASTSCCRLEHENHYFNPSLPDINRMNKCFCSLLNLDEFLQMAMKTSKYPSQLPSW